MKWEVVLFEIPPRYFAQLHGHKCVWILLPHPCFKICSMCLNSSNCLVVENVLHAISLDFFNIENSTEVLWKYSLVYAFRTVLFKVV
jgi:hypothetical protein